MRPMSAGIDLELRATDCHYLYDGQFAPYGDFPR
jgi:hypothetical protein